MVRRLRSSSNVSALSASSSEGLPFSVQESDFLEIWDWSAGFALYNQLVTTKLSHPGAADLSKSLVKIKKNLALHCDCRFVHGLPESVFDFALLWCPADAITTLKSDSEEPSWSWTAWDGPVNFPFDPTSCPDLKTLAKDEGPWFKSEIKRFDIGPQDAPYIIHRDRKDEKLRTQYPAFHHVPSKDVNSDWNILRFEAWSIKCETFSAEQLYYEDKVVPCSHLINDDDQQCGVIMDYHTSISKPSDFGPYSFVLLSRNIRREAATKTRKPKIPTMHPPGTPIWAEDHFVWDGEFADFDEDVFALGPWKMLNVMLVQWNREETEASRIAVGRIHEDAWEKCGPEMRKITLV
ncbi:hypothetical protein GQ43DRAFT_256567 [Delitschia confertaspora ATCC 74209]|uniref:Uncharacterized protein n=1 Tax=Delitschia confertaspora ATCC 74209 TaxID=1513339 RepID=A0A9P4JW15_9PLEO|nr:hypothetical protein GQ43DRAFT_256567 [Delitschia confertaspora ATCC 74209]